MTFHSIKTYWIINGIAFHCRPTREKMDKLCRQVSIESPGPLVQDFVFNFKIPVPEVPSKGARIQVVCAGACYRMRGRSASTSSTASNHSNDESSGCNSSIYGFRNSALFPGFEVAGIVDALGEEVGDNSFDIGQRVVIYPHDDLPHGYADYMIVPDLSYLVPVPDSLPMSVASMLPTGGLLAKSAVMAAKTYIEKILNQYSTNHVCKILIVGTGGLALWAIRIAEHQFKSPEFKDKVMIAVASLKDDGFRLASELPQ